MDRVWTGDWSLQKMYNSTNETSYINLVHNKNLANILTCLPEPTSIVHSVLSCKLWCHVIIIHDILCKYQPLILCGFLWPFFHPCYLLPSTRWHCRILSRWPTTYRTILRSPLLGGHGTSPIPMRASFSSSVANGVTLGDVHLGQSLPSSTH
jgi:hypothetical protein